MSMATLPEYLTLRKAVVAERETFLTALKTYLNASQRPDAGDLDEPAWNHPARQFRSQDLILNSQRGYFVLREDGATRPFRLDIEQPGHALVIDLSVVRPTQSDHGRNVFHALLERLEGAGLGPAAFVSDPEGSNVRWHCRWQLSVPTLYTDPRAVEHAHHQIWRVFDAAVISLVNK